MKRRGGDEGRTMVFELKDAERRTTKARSTEMDDLCAKLVSLIPQDYSTTTSQGSSDLPSQLMRVTAYIKDLRERVEQLKQRRDHCFSKIQQQASQSTSSRLNVETRIRAKSDGETFFDVNLATSSEKRVELHAVIQTIEEDRRVEVVDVSSCLVEGGESTAHVIKCRARGSGELDVSMVETRIGRLFMTSPAKRGGVGA
ncbi:hypothetical protein GUJ93_ZPchr0006g41764 [Zizania palustris]|uniref:BHLH domain-containing protein n=1 Tax=Zizania palustris TaxID=103762 RepID=A0A8J5SWQ8_ZIZPA|nr:hypothetical protein GUJ93_ZPchr0006g41764 [Zizania palustris]